MFTTRVRGRYEITIKRDNKIIRTVEIDNLITNNGMDRMAEQSVLFCNYCALGNGTITPQPSDTSLTNQTAISTTMTVNTAKVLYRSNPFIEGIKSTFTFPANTNYAFSEIAVGWTGTPNKVFSKALIKDEAQNTINIVVHGWRGETLEISYVFLIEPVTFFQQNLMLSGVNRTITIKPYGLENPVGWCPFDSAGSQSSFKASGLGEIPINTSILPTDATTCTSLTQGVYVSGTYYRDYTVKFDSLTANFSNGINCLYVNFNNFGKWQISIDPPIARNNGKAFIATLRQAWSR